jgi:hypothetical protein
MAANDQGSQELEQLKIISEYIKFHIGLYLATPPVFVVLAEGLKVNCSMPWLVGLGIMLVFYTVSGISAGLFMGRFINHRWNQEFPLAEIARQAFSRRRRLLHHWFYWLGLLAGMVGLLVAFVSCHLRVTYISWLEFQFQSHPRDRRASASRRWRAERSAWPSSWDAAAFMEDSAGAGSRPRIIPPPRG